MATNPFSITPGGDITQGLQGLGQAIVGLQQRREKQLDKEKAEARYKAASAAAKNAMQSNDPNVMRQAVVDYPELQQAFSMNFDFANDQSKKIVEDTYSRILSDPDNAQEYIGLGIEAVKAQGGSPDRMLQDAIALKNNPEAALDSIRMGYAAVADDQAYEEFKRQEELRAPKEKEFQMGTGDMAGYVFDKSTGQFSIDPKIKADLDRDANEKAAKEGVLDSKDIAGINDKVSALTKDSRSIYANAESLESLKNNPSAAAKLAAVFKYMKSLDPTSVVRESEQGQVYAASGAAAQLAGQLNSLLGEGKLTKKGFQDIVNTAKVLANSAVETSEREVTDYLGVLQNKLPPEDLVKLKERVPERFDVGEKTNTIAPQQAIDYLKSNPEFAGQFKEKYGYLPDENI